MFIYTNPNPAKNLVGDCVIRGVAIITNQSWVDVYDDITYKGREMYDMPSSNSVWNAYLIDLGFRKKVIQNTCPNCYTIRDFCFDHPIGEFLLATGTHVVAVIDGDYYDTWNSGDEIPIYYYEYERRN